MWCSIIGRGDLHISCIVQHGGYAIDDMVISGFQNNLRIVGQRDIARWILCAGDQRNGLPVYKLYFKNIKRGKNIIRGLALRALWTGFALGALWAGLALGALYAATGATSHLRRTAMQPEKAKFPVH